MVLAIPLGGVVVESTVERSIDWPFDVLPPMRILVPRNPEASNCDVTMNRTMAVNGPLMNFLELSMKEAELAASATIRETIREMQLYRRGRPFPALAIK